MTTLFISLAQTVNWVAPLLVVKTSGKVCDPPVGEYPLGEQPWCTPGVVLIVERNILLLRLYVLSMSEMSAYRFSNPEITFSYWPAMPSKLSTKGILVEYGPVCAFAKSDPVLPSARYVLKKSGWLLVGYVTCFSRFPSSFPSKGIWRLNGRFLEYSGSVIFQFFWPDVPGYALSSGSISWLILSNALPSVL